MIHLLTELRLALLDRLKNCLFGPFIVTKVTLKTEHKNQRKKIKEKEHIIEGSCFLSRSSSLKSKWMLVHVNIVHEGRSSRQSTTGCKNGLIMLVHVNSCIELLRLKLDDGIVLIMSDIVRHAELNQHKLGKDSTIPF